MTVTDLFPDPDPAHLHYNGIPQLYNMHYTVAGDPATYWTNAVLTSEECSNDMRMIQTALAPNNYKLSCGSTPLSTPDLAPNSCPVGKPIYPATGIEQLTETDYKGKGANALQFSRTYRSDRNSDWTSNYQVFGVDFTAPAQPTNLNLFYSGCHQGIGTGTYKSNCFRYLPSGQVNDFAVQRGNGRMLTFGTESSLDPAADINDRVTKVIDGSGVTTGWTVYNADSDATELYDLTGRLQSIIARNGLVQTLAYSDNSTPIVIAPKPGLLIRVTDAFGRSLNFGYDASSRMVTMMDPVGGIYNYTYNEASSIVLPGIQPADNLTSVTYPDGKKRIYWYNEQDKTANTNLPSALTGITDENGARYATVMYNSSGKAISTELAGGAQKYTVGYPNPFIQSVVTDPLGTSRTYNFQTILGVVKSTGTNQPGGSGCSAAASNVTYDANGNVASRTDFNQHKTCYAYDLTRNLETARVEGLNSADDCATALAAGTFSGVARKIATQWHPTFRLPTLITEPGRETGIAYDPASGNVLTKSIKDTASGKTRTWSYTYTTAADGTLPNLLKSVDGPRTDVNDVTTYGYYPNGDLNTVANALGHVTTITQYDGNGRPLSIGDPNGVTTTLTYTPRGWLESRTVGTEATRYEYDGVGQIKRLTLPDGSYIAYDYDDAHRLTDIHDAQGNTIHYTLDNIGNRTREDVYNASGTLIKTKGRVFDALNRLWKDLGALNQTTTYEYDANGNLTKIDGPLTAQNDVTTLGYDALNRLATTTDGLLHMTTYQYDGLDQLTRVTDPRTLVTGYSYDGLDDLTQTASPDTGTTVNTYDAAGNLATSTDARGSTIAYYYDALNRLTWVQKKGADWSYQLASYSYDYGANGVGRLSGMNDQSGGTWWSYDAQGRVISKQSYAWPTMFTIGYAYDAAGYLTQVTYPSGKIVGYTYTQGKVSGITVNGQPLLSNIQYQPFGPAKGWNWGNGTSYTRTFDQDGRASSYPLGSSFRNLTYDPAGHIALFTAPNPAYSQSFSYDAVGRLTDFVANTTNQNYAYDPNGNRTNIIIGATQYPYTYATTSNQLLQAAGPANKIYKYDAAGHIVEDGVNIFDYNELGRLWRVRREAVSTYYCLNGLGQRVCKSGVLIPNGGVGFAYDESRHLVGEYDNTGAAVEETVYLGDTPVAILQGSNVYYAYADHLNTTRVITDSTNKIVWRWDSDPFGSTVPDEDPDNDGVKFTYNLRFPGQYYDKETNLHYNYYRDYDPSTGRYVESDPIGLKGGINTYSYANQNPLRFIDPEGLDPFSSNSGTGGGGFTPAPTPFDVFIPGTPANNAFVQSVNQIGKAVKNLCSSNDTPNEECKKGCVAQYERDAAECGIANSFWGKKGYQACMSRAGEYLTQCMRQCDGK